MAGPDTKLSLQSTTSTTTGGYLHIILPDGGGGWLSHRIAASTFATIQLLDVIKEVNKSASFTQAFDAGTKLISIDFQQQSGSPKIKVGTTPGGDEISLTEIPIPSGDTTPINFGQSFDITTTVYITITGGAVNVNFLYTENYF